jgi:hypothetical protein
MCDIVGFVETKGSQYSGKNLILLDEGTRHTSYMNYLADAFMN